MVIIVEECCDPYTYLRYPCQNRRGSAAVPLIYGYDYRYVRFGLNALDVLIGSRTQFSSAF